MLFLTGAFALYRQLFPPPEARIRRELAELCRLVSFTTHEGDLARLANAASVASYFTSDVTVQLTGVHPDFANLSGRNGLQQVALATRTHLQRLDVRMPDQIVTLAPDGQTATVEATVVGDVNSEKTAILQEIRMTLVREGSHWRISKVVTLKALDR